jgi:hypothetical protein
MEYYKGYKVYPYTHSGKTHPDSHPEVMKFYKNIILKGKGEVEYNETKRKNSLRIVDNNNIITIGGETIISLRTITGCILRVSKKYKNGKIALSKSKKNNKTALELLNTLDKRVNFIIQNHILSSDSELNLHKMYYLYHTIGNFMPLPSDVKGKNINRCKGGKKYHDFPDRFFNDIRSNFYCESGKETNPNYSFVKSQINKDYFALFGKEKDGWNNFVKANFLEVYFEDKDYSIPKPLYCDNLFYKKPKNELSKYEESEYFHTVGNFLKNSVKIIEDRNKEIAKIQNK